MPKALSLLALLLSLSGTAWGQFSARGTSAGTISGRVTPTPGESKLPESVMVILSAAAGFRETQVLHNSGGFEFSGVPPGDYTLSLESPGRRPVVQQISLNAGIGVGQSLFFSMEIGPPLKETDDRGPAPEDKVTSARWMQLPEKVRKELREADRASRADKPEESIKHLKKALKIAPDLYHAYNNLAVEYLKLGKRKDAVAALRTSIGLNPDNAITYRNLGAIQLEDGRLDEAVTTLRKGLELDPNDWEGAFFLGEAHYGLNQWTQAAESFQRSSVLHAASPELRLYLGNCFLNLRRLDDALTQYLEFLKLEPQGERADSARDMTERLRQALGRAGGR